MALMKGHTDRHNNPPYGVQLSCQRDVCSLPSCTETDADVSISVRNLRCRPCQRLRAVQIRSATRIRALRQRGLLSTSAVDGRMGFRVRFLRVA